MNKFIFFFLFILVVLFFPQNIQAQNRAECDACGYCVGRTAPGNWEACRACVYPGASTDVTSNQTLQLNKLSSGKLEPVHKAEGKYFTQLGCLDVGENSFSDPSAPGGVLNFLLTKLIFPIVGSLAFISLIYGAFILMTAQDRPEQVGKGKSYIVGAIVGLIFTLSAILIINILAGDILKIPGFSQDKVGSDLVQIQSAITKLKNDTGKLPGGLDATICLHNQEASINGSNSGLYTSSPSFPNWNGPYLTTQVLDPKGNSYQFDPDYYCRPDVKGCEGLNYNSSNEHGNFRLVQAILYAGDDSDSNYCTNGVSGCTRKDMDNRVLVLCQ